MHVFPDFLTPTQLSSKATDYFSHFLLYVLEVQRQNMPENLPELGKEHTTTKSPVGLTTGPKIAYHNTNSIAETLL